MNKRIVSLISPLMLGAAFVAWAWLTFSGFLTGFDQWGLELFRDTNGVPVGAGITQSLVVMVTHLGDTITLLVLSLLAIGWLMLRKYRREAVTGAVSIAGLFLLNPVLKNMFARARPDIFEHVVHASTNSFPSGHALRAAGIYFLIYFLLVNRLPVKVARAMFWVFAAAAISTGISRVYLGVHWPTDIIASWLVAATWVIYWREKLTSPGSDTKKG